MREEPSNVASGAHLPRYCGPSVSYVVIPALSTGAQDTYGTVFKAGFHDEAELPCSCADVHRNRRMIEEVSQ